MRNLKAYLKDITTQAPVLFPTVALFHLLWLGMSLWSLVQQPANSTMVEVAWMVAYTFFWFGTADLKKWGALGYIGVTVVNIVIWYMAYNNHKHSPYESPLFLIDILFAFFIMFYFKRFR